MFANVTRDRRSASAAQGRVRNAAAKRPGARGDDSPPASTTRPPARRFASGAALLVLALGAVGLLPGDAAAASMPMAPPVAGVRTSYHRYTVPAVTLIDQSGHAVPLAAALGGNAPMLVQFFFSTCTTICGVRSAELVDIAPELARAGVHAAFYSISIDPEHDTPGRLMAYARQFAAAPPANWHLLTGTLPQVRRIEAAFDASDPSNDKMLHRPLTFLRGGANRPWLRINGVLGERALVRLIEASAAAPP